MTDENSDKKPSSAVHSGLENTTAKIFESGLGRHPNMVLDLGELGNVGNGPNERDALHIVFNQLRFIRDKVEIAASKTYEKLCARGAIDALREQTKNADSDGIVMTADRMIAYANDVFDQRVRQEMEKEQDSKSDHRRTTRETLAVKKKEEKPTLFSEEELTGSASYVAGVINEELDKAIAEAMSGIGKQTGNQL